MKGRKRGEKQVQEIMSHRPVCHPLFLFLNCALSLQPPAEVERERCIEDKFIYNMLFDITSIGLYPNICIFFHFFCISYKSKTWLARVKKKKLGSLNEFLILRRMSERLEWGILSNDLGRCFQDVGSQLSQCGDDVEGPGLVHTYVFGV